MAQFDIGITDGRDEINITVSRECVASAAALGMRLASLAVVSLVDPGVGHKIGFKLSEMWKTETLKEATDDAIGERAAA